MPTPSGLSPAKGASQRDGMRGESSASAASRPAVFVDNFYEPPTAEVVMHYYPPQRRIWTAFVLPLLAMACTIIVAFFSIVAFAPLGADSSILGNRQATSAWVSEFAGTKQGVFLLLLPAQLVFFIAVSIGALLSKESYGRRLGLVRGTMPVWTWFLFMAATPIVGIMTSMLLSMVFRQPTEVITLMETIFRQHTGSFFIVVLLLTSVVPGFVEELMFRGYLQKRLTERFPTNIGGIVAVSISTIFFAIVHADSVHSPGVIPLGIWLGLVAWRSGSTWPAILCHATNNAMAVLEAHFSNDTDFAVNLNPLTVAVATLSAVAFVFSISVMFRDRHYLAKFAER